ncbi:hypothetical protein BpHYR1_050468, partial [Brachionus plicatilis]
MDDVDNELAQLLLAQTSVPSSPSMLLRSVGLKRVAIQHYDKRNNKRISESQGLKNREKIFERILEVNSKRIVDASKQRKPEFSEYEDRLFACYSAK